MISRDCFNPIIPIVLRAIAIIRPEQLAQLNRIVALREMGMTLDEIRVALDSNINPDQMEQLLLQRQADIEQTLAVQAQQLQQVHHRLQQIRAETQPSPYEIVVKSLPSHPIASIRLIIEHASQIGHYCQTLHPEIHQALAKIGISAEMPTVNLYHMLNISERDIDFEASVTIPKSALGKQTDSRVTLRLLDAAPQAATLLFADSYSQMGSAVMSLLQWIARAGYRVAGTFREVHHASFVNGVQTQTGEPVVELQIPIEKLTP